MKKYWNKRGKEYAVLECTSQSYKKRENKELFITSANHYNTTEVPEEKNFVFEKSIKRQNRVEKLMQSKEFNDQPGDLIDILSDELV